MPEPKRKEEMIEEDVMTEEMPPEEPMDMTEEAPVGAGISHTADEIPELSGLQIGDSITFTVANISEDGTYELTPVVEEAPVEPETAPEETTGGMGREAIAKELL